MRSRNVTIDPLKFYGPAALKDLRTRLHRLDAVPWDVVEQAASGDQLTRGKGKGAFGVNIISRLSARGFFGFEADEPTVLYDLGGGWKLYEA